MKKILIASILILGLSFQIQAQSERKFNVGFKAGVNMYSPSFNDLSSIQTIKDNYWGFNLGLSTRFKFLFMSIQPEVIFAYSSTQMKIEDTPNGVSDIVSAKFSDISIPVMLNFHFLKIMHAGLGPIYTFQFPSFKGGSENWNALKNNFNAGSFGWQFGLGVDFWRMYVDVNYQVGFGRYKSSMEVNGNTYNFDSRPNTLWITVGIWFLDPKGKKK